MGSYMVGYSAIITLALGIGLLSLVPTVIIDLVKKKFHYSRWPLIVTVGALLLNFLSSFLGKVITG